VTLKSARRGGFTLIELSIVLVIIGLIVGGVLVGQDLIEAAALRATVSQLEKYNAAVNTFRVKYGYLPGDIPDPAATDTGLLPRGTIFVNGAPFGWPSGAGLAQGDGNSVLQSSHNDVQIDSGLLGQETTMFWVDLTYANGMNINLIEGSFNPPFVGNNPWVPQEISTANLPRYLPPAKIGRNNYVWAYSGSWSGNDNRNYFVISGLDDGSGNATYNNGVPNTNMGLTVNEAYDIDQKLDDGFPQSGSIIAFVSGNSGWASGLANSNCGRCDYNSGLFDANTGGPVTDVNDEGGGDTNSSTTCYDYANPSHPTNPPSIIYSTKANGSEVNCGLSFRFQ
jgi:prepilin-type N-terminal cleavage/methylation domain-containing protein